MVRYIYARYIGDQDDYYKNNQNYPLAIKTRWIRKKVSIYKRRGYYDEMQSGSLREYATIDQFNQQWKIISEEGIE